jgi:hypothetical protein
MRGGRHKASPTSRSDVRDPDQRSHIEWHGARFSSASTTSGWQKVGHVVLPGRPTAPPNLRISAVTVALRRAGLGYDPRRRRITCTGRQDPSLPYPLMPTSASTAGNHDHPGILFCESRCHADERAAGLAAVPDR